MNNLGPEESDLVEALLLITAEHGKFNEDATGVWAGYTPAAENEVAAIGVKCANCALYRGGTECAIIEAKVEPEGKCRFAAIPDGVVDVSKSPVGEDRDISTETYFDREREEMSDNVLINSKDAPPYDKYEIDLDELAPTQKTVNMRRVQDVYDSSKPIKVWLTSTGPRIIDGHHRAVAHKIRGLQKVMAEVYSYTDEPVTATAGSKPAPKKDRIKGSSKNAAGSAGSGRGVTFTAAITKSLEKKVADHNEKAKPGRRVTLGKLKAVYRRGAGAFSSSHRPDQNRNSWAMARVNAYLKLVRSGKPSNPKYKQDNDLLPKLHPRHKEASTMDPITAAAVLAMNDESCPPATQDITINLANREKAIEGAGYGPLNPNEPNEEFWQEKATRWSVTPEDAKKSTCGNCVLFIRTPEMLDCIEGGISAGDSGAQNAWDAIDTAELGYCEAFDFKCAASRTCSAWVVGGPITEEKPMTAEELSTSALRMRARTLSVRVGLVAAAAKPVLGPDGLPLPDQTGAPQRAPGGSRKPFDGFNESRLNAKSQFRDKRGKFRKVLARLKHNLGESGLQAVTDKLQQAQDLDFAGNYRAANRAAGKLIGLVDRIDTGALDSKSLENVRETAGELGKVIANTPLPFGDPNAKLSFSELPPSMRTLAKDMIDRVLEKLGPEDGGQAVQEMKSFMSGADQLSQSEIQSEFNVLLRLLT